MTTQLLFAGLLFLVIEAFIPGFGVFGSLGILCLLGSLYLYLGATTQAAALVGCLLIVLVLAVLWLVRRGPKSWLGHHLTLHLRSTKSQGYTGNEERTDLMGKTGVAQTVLRPSGRALIDGQLVDVITDGEFYEPGTKVKVVAVTGGRTVVRKEA